MKTTLIILLFIVLCTFLFCNTLKEPKPKPVETICVMCLCSIDTVREEALREWLDNYTRFEFKKEIRDRNYMKHCFKQLDCVRLSISGTELAVVIVAFEGKTMAKIKDIETGLHWYAKLRDMSFFPGNYLQRTQEEMREWNDKYFKPCAKPS